MVGKGCAFGHHLGICEDDKSHIQLVVIFVTHPTAPLSTFVIQQILHHYVLCQWAEIDHVRPLRCPRWMLAVILLLLWPVESVLILRILMLPSTEDVIHKTVVAVEHNVVRAASQPSQIATDTGMHR